MSQEKAKSRSVSLRPDQKAKLYPILEEYGMKPSHYFQLLVDRDLAGTAGKTYSRALADRTAPSDDRIARFEKVIDHAEKFFRDREKK